MLNVKRWHTPSGEFSHDEYTGSNVIFSTDSENLVLRDENGEKHLYLLSQARAIHAELTELFAILDEK